MRRHGWATWRAVRKNLAKQPTCPKLKAYWHFHDCRYQKTKRTCAEPDHLEKCPLPTHRPRNGHLNQLAYSLYLFIRDVADGDLIGWIDDRLDQANDPLAPDRLARACNALIEPLRNIYGVSDKVLAIGLSGILIRRRRCSPQVVRSRRAADRSRYLGPQFSASDRYLEALKATHPYGVGCYRPGGCADIIARVASQIDARRSIAHFRSLPSLRAARDLAVLQPARPRHLQRQPHR